MTLHLLVELFAKSFLISGIVLALIAALKRRSAAERSWIGHMGLTILLLLPMAPLLLPRWRLLTPVATPVSPSDTSTGGVDPATVLVALYAACAGLVLLGTLVSVLRLFVLQRQAQVVTEAGWLTALARAQQRMGLKYGAILLVSETVSSPLSWGLARPVILLDEGILSRPGSAEAVITHELAHVAHGDWLKLLLSRTVTALFWFNPLVWALAHQCHQLREEAADDAVLRADVSGPDYASLLVEAARHENRALFSAAHGVAASKTSLHQRVVRVLDPTSSRKAASARWAIAGLTGLSMLVTPLIAATLERLAVAVPATPAPAVRESARSPVESIRTRPIEERPQRRIGVPQEARPLRAVLQADTPERIVSFKAAETAPPADTGREIRTLSLDGSTLSVQSDRRSQTLRGNTVDESPADEVSKPKAPTVTVTTSH